MTEHVLNIECVSAFLTGLCVIWTIRAATKISRDFEKLYELEKEYKRYLDRQTARIGAIIFEWCKPGTYITVKNEWREQSDE